MWIKALARSLIIAVGVFAIIKAIEMMDRFVMILGVGSLAQSQQPILRILVSSLVIPVILFAVGLLLIFRPPSWLLNLIPEHTGEAGVQVAPATIVFHAISIVFGLLLLFLALPRLINIVGGLWVLPRVARDPNIEQFTRMILLNSAIFAVQAAAGIYFLLGAPHFVRWQLKKLRVLEQAPQTPDSQPTV